VPHVHESFAGKGKNSWWLRLYTGLLSCLVYLSGNFLVWKETYDEASEYRLAVNIRSCVSPMKVNANAKSVVAFCLAHHRQGSVLSIEAVMLELHHTGSI